MYWPIHSQSATGTTMNDDVNWSLKFSALSLNEFLESTISALLGNYYEFFYAVKMCFKSNMLFIWLGYCL